MLCGCAAAPRPSAAPARFDASAEPVELVEVPFFPQQAYQCGPAALATVLAHAGVPVEPAELAPAVYVEGLKGSLQAELLAATRRRGLVPYPIDGDPAALLAELESGKPILVLQNLGLRRFPVWHYAVVVGFDAERERVLLRSGTERRRQEPARRFLRSWARAERWAFVVAAPAEPPATATPERWIRAVTDAGRLLSDDALDAAHRAAAERWPRNELVRFAAAGHHAGAGRWQAAREAYEALLAESPGHVAARNNLAHVLAAQGCGRAALLEARRALKSIDAEHPLHPAVEDTVRALAGGTPEGGDPRHCPP